MKKLISDLIIPIAILIAATIAIVTARSLMEPSQLHGAEKAEPDRFTIEKVGRMSSGSLVDLITDTKTGRQYLAGFHSGMVEVNQEPIRRP
jgi:hypothetical protein